MRAIAKCESCEKQLETTCRGCIEAGIDYHKCIDGFKVVQVKWKVYPQNKNN